MFRVLALLPILSVAAHTVNSLRLNVVRQDPVADCSTPCTALTDSISASGTGVGAICNNNVLNNYVGCYDCEVKIGGMTQQAAQQTVDSYVSGCKAGGHPVNDATISADGSASGASGSSNSSSPAASGAAPASSGASGTPAKTGGAVRISTGLLGATSALVLLACGMAI